MLIREATRDDALDVVRLAYVFLSSTAYGALLKPNPDALANLVMLVLEHGRIWVAEHDAKIVGMLAIVEAEHPVTGEKYADELAWFVEPAHRRSSVGPRLLGCAETYTQQKGLSMIKMVAPVGTDVGEFYIRRGYAPVETSYVKRLT